jgi:hypothetical protein
MSRVYVVRSRVPGLGSGGDVRFNNVSNTTTARQGKKSDETCGR